MSVYNDCFVTGRGKPMSLCITQHAEFQYITGKKRKVMDPNSWIALFNTHCIDIQLKRLSTWQKIARQTDGRQTVAALWQQAGSQSSDVHKGRQGGRLTGFETMKVSWLSATSSFQTAWCNKHTVLHTHTHTRSLPGLAPLAAALSSTRRHAAFRGGKHDAFESVGVGLCTCSRRSCYGSAPLLKRQSDRLVSRGLVISFTTLSDRFMQRSGLKWMWTWYISSYAAWLWAVLLQIRRGNSYSYGK